MKFSSPQGKLTTDQCMIYLKVRRMHAATVTDFVQLFPPHDHVIDLMPPSRTRVHPCDFGAHRASKIRVCKTDMEGRAQLKQTLAILKIPFTNYQHLKTSQAILASGCFG